MQCSIGIVELSKKYKTCDQVLNDVDVALYRAKNEDRAWWVLFDEELDARTKRARMLQPELKQAIVDKNLKLFFQPIVNINEEKIKGFEALSRWDREDGEKISPDEFIPLAEKTGLINDIGLWVLEIACEQLSKWQTLGLTDEDFYVSVNVAPTSLHDERFYQILEELIEQHDIKPGQLKLELTERILIKDRESTLTKLNNLIGLGCKLMIDDFGTGYSSLSYLHRMPVSTVKIDRSFVMNLEDEESTVPVVKTIIALAESLGMNVISEGIETELQSKTLTEMGSHQLQGYLFSKPLPADEATEFLKSYNSKAN